MLETLMQLYECVYYKMSVYQMHKIRETFHYFIRLHYIGRSPLNEGQKIVSLNPVCKVYTELQNGLLGIAIMFHT